MIMFLSGKIISGNNCYFQSNQSQSVVPLVWIAVMLDFVYVIYKLIREFNIDLGKIKQKSVKRCGSNLLASKFGRYECGPVSLLLSLPP